MQGPGTTKIIVRRRIGADPTGTALLLAGPTALELWPGVRRIREVEGRLLVEADLSETPGLAAAAARRATARVRALPPRRTPTAFVTEFEWTGPGLPATTGQLTLGYAPGDGGPSTRAELSLETDDDLTGSPLSVPVLTAMAEGFLANLAHAAEVRSSAA